MSKFFKKVRDKKTDAKLCIACNKGLIRTGYSNHIKPNNHLLKAGEISNWEIFVKKSIG